MLFCGQDLAKMLVVEIFKNVSNLQTIKTENRGEREEENGDVDS
jgi:hypothetical protein